MAFGRHVIKIRKIALERQNGAQSKAHGLKNVGKILRKFLSKNVHFGVLGVKF